MKKSPIRFLLSALVFGIASAAPAATPTAPSTNSDLPTFEVRVGAFLLSDIQTDLRLEAELSSGSTLDFGKELGGDSSLTVFRADVDWHFARSHEITASWYDLEVNGSRTLSDSISFGGEEFPINATVESMFRTNIVKLAYGYTFNRGARHEFTGLIGAHVLSLETSIKSTASTREPRFSVTAPLPAIGFAWAAHWSERFSTLVSLQYFGLSVDEGKYSGHFTDGLISGQYRFLNHWGVGAGYNRFELSTELNNDNQRLTVEHKYNGLLFYIFCEF